MNATKVTQRRAAGDAGRRAKRFPITEALRMELQLVGPDGVTNAEAIARKLVQMARNGDRGALQLIVNLVIGTAR